MTASTCLAREQWVRATPFVPLSDREVLALARRRVGETKAAGGEPLVLFDIDGTLYDNRPRVLQILQDWIRQAPEAPEDLRVRLQALAPADLDYSVPDALERAGLSPADPAYARLVDAAEAFWKPRFFSNDYLELDICFPGAASYARALVARGASLFYVTGRDEPNMGEGTRRVLRRDGFPIDGRATLALKREWKESDAGHKLEVVRSLPAGRVAAVFDNEPSILVQTHAQLPDAMAIYRHSWCSDTPAPVVPGLYQLRAWDHADDTTERATLVRPAPR